MKALVATVILLIFSSLAYAQDQIAQALKNLLDNERYDDIIEHSSRSENYTANSLYYIGLAYYMTEDDTNCLRFRRG